MSTLLSLTMFLMSEASFDRLGAALLKSGYGIRPGLEPKVAGGTDRLTSLPGPSGFSTVLHVILSVEKNKARSAVYDDIVRLARELNVPFFGLVLTDGTGSSLGNGFRPELPKKKKVVDEGPLGRLVPFPKKDDGIIDG